MRGSIRLLAKVQPGRLLETNAPTGITGLLNHPHPRSTLIYTYNEILSKLQSVPESSVYRQSTEATTRSRLRIVQGVIPAGYEEWQARVKAQIAKDPNAYEQATLKDGSLSFHVPPSNLEEDGRKQRTPPRQEGAFSEATAKATSEAVLAEVEEVDSVQGPTPGDLELEPPLDADQIGEIEAKIGSGLIEEVIAVAEGELELVDEMIAYRVWEPLEDKAPPDQWTYFERGAHTKTN